MAAHFTQITKSRRFGEKKVSGEVWMQTPGKMRWDYAEPKGKTLVSNGVEIVAFDPEDNQAQVYKFKKDADLPIPFSLLWGKENIEKNFTVKIEKESKDKNTVTLECTPKKEIPNVNKVYLTLQKGKKLLVTGTRVLFSIGDENEILFSQIQINQDVTPQRFIFNLPKGAIRVEAALSKN